MATDQRQNSCTGLSRCCNFQGLRKLYRPRRPSGLWPTVKQDKLSKGSLLWSCLTVDPTCCLWLDTSSDISAASDTRTGEDPTAMKHSTFQVPETEASAETCLAHGQPEVTHAASSCTVYAEQQAWLRLQVSQGTRTKLKVPKWACMLGAFAYL